MGIRVAILGAGWPGLKHAEGYRAAAGFELAAVADPIPSRRQALVKQFGIGIENADAEKLLIESRDAFDAVSICLPNHLHLPTALLALKAGKHVMLETPPVISAAEAKKLSAAATKAGKVVLFAAQRRFGGAEQAAQQAIAKGYIGAVTHARASWMRTRGVPAGTGWFTERSKSGGGAMLDLGLPMLDLAWTLMGEPAPESVFAATQQLKPEQIPAGAQSPRDAESAVESAGFALLRFEGGKSLELAASWAVNQSPRHQGTQCRLHAEIGAIDLYTPQGPLLYRNFGPKGEAKETQLKLPKNVLHHALMRHFKHAILGKETAGPGIAQLVALAQMIEAIYKSAATGKSVAIG